MDAHNEIINLMAAKREVQLAISKLRSDLGAIDAKMIEIATTELNLKIGDEVKSPRTKKQSISKFEEVVFDHTLECPTLLAQCYELKNDGTIDRRVDPRYNVKTVGVIRR